jgi:hypothetical protein
MPDLFLVGAALLNVCTANVGGSGNTQDYRGYVDVQVDEQYLPILNSQAVRDGFVSRRAGKVSN